MPPTEPPPSVLLEAYLAGVAVPPPVLPPPRPTATWVVIDVLALACAALAGAPLAGGGVSAPEAAVTLPPVPGHTAAGASTDGTLAQVLSAEMCPTIALNGSGWVIGVDWTVSHAEGMFGQPA